MSDTQNNETQTSGEATQTSKTRVSAEKFITVWERSANAREAAKELGLTPNSATQRASSYRKAGIDLKHMPRGGAKLDVSAANALLASLREKSENGEQQEQEQTQNAE